MLRAALAIGWNVVVTILTLMPGKDLPHVGVIGFDKAAHLGCFGLMALLYMIWNDARPTVRPWIIALLCALYGVVIEILQGALTADRTADPFDALANATGCALALASLSWFLPIVSRRK